MSNRLTFSLASLIVLIALGLVFAPTSVMAHPDATANSATTPRVHSHPLIEGLDAQTDNTQTPGDLGTAVTAHNHHPVVQSITLKEVDDKTSGNMVVITDPSATDGTAADAQFTLVVTFDREVVSAATIRSAAADNDGATPPVDNTVLASTGFMSSITNADLSAQTTAKVAFADATRVAGTTDQFEAVVTIAGAFPAGNSGADAFLVKLNVNADAAFSVQIRPTQLHTAVNGIGNAASMLESFMLVNALPTPPTPPDAPASLMADTDHQNGTVTLTWTAVANAMYEYSSDGGTMWMDATSPQEVTGLTANEDVVLMVRVKAVAATGTTAAVPAGAVASVTVNIDQMAPTVTVKAPTKGATDLVFTIDFNEALGIGLSALTVEDFEIDGGSAMAADLTGPNATHDYELTVTPDSDDASVTVTLLPNTVADVVGNVVDVTDTDNMPSATYDITPPTVVITPPDMPDADGNLTFTFDFSEAVNPDTITLDRAGSDNVRLGPNSNPMVDDDDNTIYTILVEPRNPAVATTVLLLKGSVMDLNGNGLAADAEATYMPPVTNSPPVFEDETPRTYVFCEGEDMGDMAILLPLARDSEGDTLTYMLLAADGAVQTEIPNSITAPSDGGLYWVNVDAETRYLRGSAKLSNGPAPNGLKYTWQVTDEHEAKAMKPVELTIVVHPYQKPNVVTDAMAMKVDGIAKVGDDVDNVKLTWTNPNPTAAQPVYVAGQPCIPAVTHYIISRQELNTHTQGRTAKGAAVTMTLTVAEATKAGGLEYITDKLDHGTYEFTITARNRAGDSGPTNPKAIWDRTSYHWVIVNDPPVASTNLRANQTARPAHSVTLDWIPPTHNPNAPVNDAADAMALYGVDTAFGGYHVEVTNQANGTITRHPRTGLIDGDRRTHHITGLAVGEYTARIVAHNVVGEGALSNSQDFEIDVHQPPTTTPNKPPVFAADASIANIEATVGVRVPGRFLPKATDADGDDLTYELDPTLPAGLSFDDDTLALTGMPTAVTAETAYTYTVSDGEDEITLRFFITVNAATAGPPATSTPTTMLPAQGYIVYIRDLNNRPHFGTSSPLVAEWSAMPNLYELFSEGGGGSLQLNVTGVNARQVVFSEVMWAVDLGKVGQDSYDDNQWIELRNRTDNAIAISNISFAFKADGRPALPQGTDLISNVVGAGDNWIKDGKGQNGNSTAGSLIPFKSMRRTRYHNDSAGWAAGQWDTADQVYHLNNYGTPGVGEIKGPVVIGTTTVPRSPMIFNEISNNSNSAHEWIELRNVSGGNVNLKNWEVTMVTAVNSDVDLIDFTGADRNVPAGEVVLIVKSDPTGDESHPLAGGWNFGATGAWAPAGPGQANYVPGVNADSPRYIVAAKFEALPDNGEFVLILRDHQGKNGTKDHIKDVAGHMPGTRLKVETGNAFTNLWPLSNFHNANAEQNKFTAGTVHRRQKDGTNGTDRSRRDRGGNADDGAFRDDGWTGIGYKRNATPSAQNGGTPGYKHGVLRSNDNDANSAVIISEIMPTKGERNLPEWIELRNVSRTIGVSVDNWRLTITNHDSDGAEGTYDGDLSHTITLSGRIPPGQTYLIVARNGRNQTNLPSQRIKNVGRSRTQHLINPYGFEIKLESKKDNNFLNVDTVGNLGEAQGRRSRSFAPIMWEWPASMDESGDRISIVRASISGSSVDDGTTRMAWRSFEVARQPDEVTFYGHQSDFGSPGHTAGGVLPVSLSAFRADRLATNEIVIRWTTESETNNAGFNILRSDSRDGEFTKLNTQLIAGQGTTSERSVYKFTDTSAKPNVVYYYQIQDVSFDGDIATLRTSRLRGHVSPGGKATTTWGELKSLQ